MLHRICHKSKMYLKRNSSTILMCIGTIGVIVTSITVAKAAPKAVKLLEKATYEKGEELTKIEIISVAVPVYIPSVIMGISTIACIFGAHVLNKQTQTALTSAYAMLNESYKQYKKAAISVYGENADVKITEEMAKDTYISTDGYFLYDCELDYSEKELFYDAYSQRYFASTIAAVINAQYHINRNLALRGDVTLNEFYDFLGIEKTDYGETIGWSISDMADDGIMWLDFENRHTVSCHDKKCCIISYMIDPTVFDVE